LSATTDEDSALRISVNRKLNIAYVHHPRRPNTWNNPKQKMPLRLPFNGAQRRFVAVAWCPREDSNLHGL